MSSVVVLLCVCIAAVQYTANRVEASGCCAYDSLGNNDFIKISSPEISTLYPFGKWAVGRKIFIKGGDRSRSRFSINLVDGTGDDRNFVMHVDFRFRYFYAPANIVYNTKVNGGWERDWTVTNYTDAAWPIETLLPFCMELELLQDKFKMTITKYTGGKTVLEFPYKASVRTQLTTKPLYLVIGDNLHLSQIDWTAHFECPQ